MRHGARSPGLLPVFRTTDCARGASQEGFPGGRVGSARDDRPATPGARGQRPARAGVHETARVNRQTFYRWRKRYGGLTRDDAQRLKRPEPENAQLKALLANRNLKVEYAIGTELTVVRGLLARCPSREARSAHAVHAPRLARPAPLRCLFAMPTCGACVPCLARTRKSLPH